MTVARHIWITGRVQGVFYRVWARDQARELHLTGWVRNSSDGSVEAHIEGDGGDVSTMIERMRRGPPAAVVEHVVDEVVEPTGSQRFEVRH